MEGALFDQCESLITAIRQIIQNWESGDLAGAVNNARELADIAEDFLTNHCADV